MFSRLLQASEQDFLATDVLASFVASDHVLSDRKRELGLQLVDWDRDGDLDLLIGPWELQSSSYWVAWSCFQSFRCTKALFDSPFL